MPDHEPSDASLLDEWLRHQSEPAFVALVRRYQALVHDVALRRCADDSLAAEASQLAFISLAQKAGSLRSRTSLAGWLHLTALHHSRNLLRRRRREAHKLQRLRTHMDTQLPDIHSDAWRQIQPAVDEALASLSEQDRETLLLRFYRSLSVKEIAAMQGIAFNAAQKRLDRATERLRRLLARRGHTPGGSLASALLVGLAHDPTILLPPVSTIASKAIASATATSTLTTLGILTMTKKATTLTAAALLIAGVGAIAYVNRSHAPDKQPESTTSSNAGQKSSGSSPSSAETARAARAKPRDPAENPEFVTKYGESRTKLSKQVSENVISLLEDAISMGEMATSGELSKAFGGRGAGLQMGLGKLGRDLNLTDEQKEKAGALYTEFQKREIEKAKASVENLKKDPTALMQTLLASDAFSRGKITEAEYKEAQTASAQELKGVMNPLDRKNFGGGKPTKDPTFSSGFQALLDPTQAETYQASLAAQEAEPADTSDISNIPAMELEKLDGTVMSAKKMTSGLKQMMEGMGGLQDLGPLLEQQQKQKSEP
jgi:RNA polymerase sigma factor (sigma-70 family)